MAYVILGVGAAGMKAAAEIKSLSPGTEVVMISKDRYVHSRCMLHQYLSHERDEQTLNFTDPDFFEKHHIYWIQEGVHRIDTAGRSVTTENGTQIVYEKLLIATGANSFIPPVGELRQGKNVFGLRHLTDAQAIDQMAEHSEKILVIGSGLVGLDAAYGLLERGKQVTIVEMAPQILPVQLDAHGALEYQKRFEKAGATFYLGRKADQAVCGEDGMIRSVTLDDGTKLDCDMIIVAAGVRSAVECLEGSGILADRGIKVNEYMETNIPDVYAAGDVTGLSGIWPNAQKQGRVAAQNMCGFRFAYDDPFAAKNTINFYGLVSLCVGRIKAEEGDCVVIQEDKNVYRRAVIRDNRVEGILLQGDISGAGIWQYLIKNRIDIGHIRKPVFQLTFADFYGVGEKGKYQWVTAAE